MISNRQKALIHVAKSRTGMTEGEYRAMLAGFGVASSTQLTREQFEKVKAHFVKLGFRPFRAATPEPKSSRELLRAKVAALLADLRLADAYADAIARSRFNVDAWIWLKADALYKLAAMLSYHQRRHPKRKGHR